MNVCQETPYVVKLCQNCSALLLPVILNCHKLLSLGERMSGFRIAMGGTHDLNVQKCYMYVACMGVTVYHKSVPAKWQKD